MKTETSQPKPSPSFQDRVSIAVAAGFLLRTSEAYKTATFVGGERVVSELGTQGVVQTVNQGKPATIEIVCQVTGNKRIIKAQDFFQVIHDGTKAAALQARKAGLVRPAAPQPNRPPSITADKKLLEEALKMSLISEVQYQNELSKLQARQDEHKARAQANQEQAKAAAKEQRAEEQLDSKKQKLLAELKARGFATPVEG